MKYVNRFTKAEQKTIAIDFDGVIHNHFLGYHDGTIYGEAISDSIESIKTLYGMGYEIVIYSCKCHPERPLVKEKSGKQLIWEWLKENKIDKFIKEVSWGKPHALIYIDDKGYRFENWKDTMKFMEKIK
jgi:histidinol phosphatase-like enzyme